MSKVGTYTPPGTPQPIGPYSHISRVGTSITIGGTAGFDPATGELAGPDVTAQTRQILDSFRVMLEAVGSDLSHVVHINVFLRDMRDFEAMNAAYAERMGLAPSKPSGPRCVLLDIGLPKLNGYEVAQRLAGP